MAWFHFCSANHNSVGRPTLGEMAKWFEAGLLDLGHEVSFSERYVEHGAINIFWESFNRDFNRQLRESRIPFGIIGTEIPDGSGFNWRRDGAWPARFAAFEEIASEAKFVWTTIESAIPYYGTFSSTAFVELGFSERLLPIHQNADPDIDFFFYGLDTPYRRAAVEKIRRYATVEWPAHFLSDADVEILISRGKVGLNFKQSERWPIPSPTRLGRLLMAKRAVAAEFVPVPTRQGELVGICPAEVDFADYALTVLRSDWKARAKGAFEVYRETMHMKNIMQCVLDLTLSTVPNRSQSQSAGKKVLEWTESPQRISTIDHWNIVHWNKTYFALHKCLGEIDVTIGRETLLKAYGNGYIMSGPDLTLLQMEVDALNRKPMFKVRGLSYSIRRLAKKLSKKMRKTYRGVGSGEAR